MLAPVADELGVVGVGEALLGVVAGGATVVWLAALTLGTARRAGIAPAGEIEIGVIWNCTRLTAGPRGWGAA